jgi:hypothetical protein
VAQGVASKSLIWWILWQILQGMSRLNNGAGMIFRHQLSFIIGCQPATPRPPKKSHGSPKFGFLWSLVAPIGSRRYVKPIEPLRLGCPAEISQRQQSPDAVGDQTSCPRSPTATPLVVPCPRPSPI